MRSFFLKTFAVVVAVVGAGLWLALAPFFWGSYAFQGPDAAITRFFTYLGVGYFLALGWAAFVRHKKSFLACGLTAHAIFAVELGRIVWSDYQLNFAHAAVNSFQDVAALFFDRIISLALIFLLPTLAWTLLRANLYQRDFLPILKGFVTVMGALGLLMWCGFGNIGGVLNFVPGDEAFHPVLFFFFLLGLGYFFVLIWAAYRLHAKGFYLKLLAAQFILVVEIFFNLASSFYDVGVTRDVWFIPLMGNFGLRVIILWAIFFLPSWAWGLLLVARLKPAWFKKVDISPNLG